MKKNADFSVRHPKKSAFFVAWIAGPAHNVVTNMPVTERRRMNRLVGILPMTRWLLLKKLLAPFSRKYADSVALHRCTALRKKGAYREAYALLRDVMGRYPEWRNGDLYVGCANLALLANDDVATANKLLDTALRLGCKDMAAYYCMSGYVLLRVGDRERGLREMERAAELKPIVYYLHALASELSFCGDVRAAGIWKRVMEQEPLNCQAHIGLGILAEKTGDREKALHMARRAEALCSSGYDLLDIARLYARIGEYQTALDRYAQAERLVQELTGPTCADIAACHFELGNTLEGCQWLEKGRRRFPNSQSMKEVWEQYKGQCTDGSAPGAQEA